MSSPQLTLFHLSDIHFHKASPYDLDESLRHELLLDARRVVKDVGAVDAILVSGDVAFSGKAEEYEAARAWLEKLSGETGSAIEKVRVIPGNHDVDRSGLGSPLLEAAREGLRDLEYNQMNGRLRQYLEDKDSYELLMRPMENYNRFAGAFGCDIRPDHLWWEDDFTLNNGSTLRVRGLHSALLSDHRDTTRDERRKMIVGALQATMRREDGVAYLCMCHHPPDWLRDVEFVESTLNARASIQLFGHKHKHDLFVRDNKLLRLGAGALHPDRGEAGWEPRYNVFRLSVDNGPHGRVLRVEVRLRVWNAADEEFQADFNRMKNKDHLVYELALPDWERPRTSSGASSPVVSGGTSQSDQNVQDVADLGNVTPPSVDAPSVLSSTDDTLNTAQDVIDPDVLWIKEKTMDAKRKLAYRYLTLPYLSIVQVAVKLDLMRDEDEAVTDKNELYRRFLARAEEAELMEQLWDEVANRRNDMKDENPFKPSTVLS
jgi:predicted phosphohydrolase